MLAGGSYTLRLTAPFTGSVRIRKEASDFTLRTDTINLGSTPQPLAAGVERVVAFTIPAATPHGNGNYVVEIDADGDGDGAYSVFAHDPLIRTAPVHTPEIRMGLLDSLKLKPPKNWPPRPPAARAAATAIGAAVVDATPEVFETQGRSAQSPRRVSSMPVEPVAAASAAPRKAGDGPPLGRTDEAGFGDFSLGIKESEDGSSLVVKYEKKQNIGRQNFKVWVIPCYVKADLKLAIEGEIDFADAGRRSLKVSAGGSIEVSAFGYTSEIVTFGPNGTGTLSASTSLPTRLSEARKLAIEPFVIDIHGNGTVGIKVEIEGGPTSGASVELANWHLFVIHVGTYVNGGFASVRVEPGKDMKRLIAAMEKAGPAIADTVEKYAPDGVKQIAEEAARWVRRGPQVQGHRGCDAEGAG